MAKISLLQALEDVSSLNFDYTISQVMPSMSTTGEKIVVLQLLKVKDKVIGSQRIPDRENGGDLIPVTAVDVTEVKVLKSTIEKYKEAFTFDEELEVGFVKSADLMLDVAKSTLEVWIVSEPYAQLGATARNNRNSERLKRIRAANGLDAPKENVG